MAEDFKGDIDLFNNPMVQSARKSMKPEDLQRYKDWGEAVFTDDIDYETASVTKYPSPMLDALAYIETAIKSGQHPSTLRDDEKKLLEEMRGKEWYKKWGYEEGDLTEIINVLTIDDK
jgi:hypothetical protein